MTSAHLRSPARWAKPPLQPPPLCAGCCFTSAFPVTTAARLPAITAVTPSSGPVGTAVTIAGTNLSGASLVTFGGGGPAPFTVVSPTTITATVPGGTTTGAVQVTTALNGAVLIGTATSPGSFTVTPATI